MNNTRLASIRGKAIAFTAVVVMAGAPFLRAQTRAVPGEERRWTLDFRTRLEQQGTARPIEIHISGDWVSAVSAVRPGEYDAALRIANMRLSIAGNNVPADQSEELRQKLSRPFWATYREDGALLAVHFYKDVDPSDRNLLQKIATECQYVRSSPDRKSWTVTERDGNGQYMASYERTTSNLVTKHKMKYLRADAGSKTESHDVHLDIEQSEYRFTLDADGGALSLDAVVRTRTAVPLGAAGLFTAVTETHLAGLRKSQAPDMAGSLARTLNAESSPIRTHQLDPERLRERLDSQLLEGHSTERLLEAALLDTGKSTEEDPRLPDRLAALFRRRPEAAATALERLRKSGPHGRITDALGAAGSPAAIEALVSIARDPALPRPLRIDALNAFVLMRNPRVEAMRAPIALLDDEDRPVAYAARLSSGTLARAGRAAYPQEADQIDAALVVRYRKAQDPAELTELLSAMGNSIGKPVMPVIEGALHDQRDAVRAAAARALRLADGPEIEGLLSATIANDRDAGVRAAAIFAAGFRNPIGANLAGALLQAAKADPAEQVRTSAMTLLRQHPGASPRLAETLTWIAGNDPQPGVRRLAQEMLKSL